MYNFWIRFISCFIISKQRREAFRERHLRGAGQDNLTEAIFSLILIGVDNSINDSQIAEIFGKDCMVLDKEGISSNLSFLFSKPLLEYKGKGHPKYVLIWGSQNKKRQAELAVKALAERIPIIRMEDGFLRSADTWCNTAIDKRYTEGISFTFSNDVHYFDATRSSMMERLINDRNLTFSPVQLARARRCIDFITRNYLTKYNHQPIYTPIIGNRGRPKVLVIDQSYGDFSISKGLANDETFERMLYAAQQENPQADIIIKTHPDIMASGTYRTRGYYTGYKQHDSVYTLTTPVNPISLIKLCNKVYVCSTQFGFEALMCGKEVHTFGMPFYAGWGLTQDALSCPRRTNRRSLEEIFYIAYILYSYYVNPLTGKRCEIEEAMDYLLAIRKEYFQKFNIRDERETSPS